MALTIINPVGDDNPVCVKQPVLFEAKVTAPQLVSRLDWRVSVNGGPFGPPFASNVAKVVYTAPTSVVNADTGGNTGLDVLTIQVKDRVSLVADTTTLILLDGIPKIECTVSGDAPTSDVGTLSFQPQHQSHPGGMTDGHHPDGPVTWWKGGEGEDPKDVSLPETPAGFDP